MIEGNVRGLFLARATAHRNPIPKGNLPSIEKCFPLRQNRPAQRNRTNKFLLNCSYRLVGLQRPFVTLKPLHHLYPCICVNNCRLMWGKCVSIVSYPDPSATETTECLSLAILVA